MGDVTTVTRSAKADALFGWRLRRLLAAVDPVVDAIVAPYATDYCLRPLRRTERAGDGLAVVEWQVDGEVLVELIFDGRGRLVVHDIALLRPLRRRLRTRRITIEHSTSA